MTEEEFKKLTKDRQEAFTKCKIFSDATVVVASVLKQMVEDMLNLCEENRIVIDKFERLEWKRMLTALARINTLAMEHGADMYEKYKQVVKLVYFLIKEIIAKCDDSDMRVWQFHNLLKSFPTVRPELLPSYEEEIDVFGHIFES